MAENFERHVARQESRVHENDFAELDGVRPLARLRECQRLRKTRHDDLPGEKDLHVLDLEFRLVDDDGGRFGFDGEADFPRPAVHAAMLDPRVADNVKSEGNEKWQNEKFKQAGGFHFMMMIKHETSNPNTKKL